VLLSVEPSVRLGSFWVHSVTGQTYRLTPLFTPLAQQDIAVCVGHSINKEDYCRPEAVLVLFLTALLRQSSYLWLMD